jgi:hypothetical protein
MLRLWDVHRDHLVRYIEWKYFHASRDSLTTQSLFRQFLSYPLLGGVLFGLISWNGRWNKK